jgi:hypothetical protein
MVDSLGYTILDPSTGQPIDIGPVAVPSYASGEGAFVRENENERKTRDAHKKGTGVRLEVYWNCTNYATEAAKKGAPGSQSELALLYIRGDSRLISQMATRTETRGAQVEVRQRPKLVLEGWHTDIRPNLDSLPFYYRNV